MRTWGVLVLLAAFAGSAGADANADVRALLGKYVHALAEMRPDAANQLQTSDAVIVSVEGGAGSDAETYRAIYGADAGEAKMQLAEAKVVVDKHVAWFHCVVNTSWVMELYDEKGPNRRRDTGQLRISGIAIDDHGWKIAAAMVADVVPDKSLYKVLDHDSTRPAAIDGQADSAGGAVARWLYEGTLAAHQARTAIANGTAPAERGENTAAANLAKGWDKLKMWSTPITSKTFGGGAYAIVFEHVFLPVKGQGTARMVLGAVLAKQGDDWRWVTLSFSPQSGW
jgi:hypothetical protein